ncbi:hypothetical protein AbraIFM66951_007430 [Aspergillus brasiliensis]|nr:hypothetical protein AbraIFM66951_007430 [Aspergillus brasiliensis]
MVQDSLRAPPIWNRPQQGKHNMAQIPVRQDVDNPSARDESAPALGGLRTQDHYAITQPLPPRHDPAHTREPSPSENRSQSQHQSSMAMPSGNEATQPLNAVVRRLQLCRIRRQYQHPRVTDLNLLRDPEPSHVRHSFGEEIKAENGGILLDDILPISPLTPRQCEEEGCGKWFDDDDELCDHEALDHNYPEDCTCRRCLEAFDSRLEKRVHDLYHHSDVLYRERDERSSKGLEN